MKNILSLLYISFLCNTSLSQEGSKDSVQTITTYHSNGQKKTVTEVIIINGWPEKNGLYQEYDTAGTLRIDGHYSYHNDTTECLGCFVLQPSDSSFHQFKRSNCSEIRTGTWYFYYENGNIQESGSYSKRIHEVTRLGTDPDFGTDDSEWYIGTELHYLKNGQWNCFDTSGKLIRMEWYIDGYLVLIKET